MKKRPILKGFLIGVWLLCCFSCFSVEESPKPVLRWAADTDSGVPFVFHDLDEPDRLVGFEVDIVNAVCNVMGYEPQLSTNDWGALLLGFDRDMYDVVVNGILITPERQAKADFSKPYYIEYQQLVVRSNNDTIDSLDDCQDLVVGTCMHTPGVAILEDLGVSDMRLYEDEGSCFNDLANGRIDVVLLNAAAAIYYAGVHPDLKLVGQPIGYFPVAMAFPKGTHPELIEKVNSAIDILIENGKLREIFERWNLWNTYLADYTQDYRPSMTVPVEYERFMEAERPQNLTFGKRLKMYAGFLPILGLGAWMTVKISVFSMLLAMAVGLVLALMRVYGPWPVKYTAVAIIELIRGTPLLIQLFIIFYGLPGIGIRLDPFIAGVVGLGINYAAFEAENYRAGLLSIPKGQMEAAMALAMSHWEALRHVILPQAIRIVIPPVTNDFISLLKDSSLVSMLTIVELTYRYNQLAATYYDFFGIGLLVAAIYLVLGLPFVRLAKVAERKLAIPHR
tara:strand:+ start:6356 stop:7876 length:1521 start_codon:yes stop_codon:yes gene_type:complete